MEQEIAHLVNEVREWLSGKGVSYDSLKSVLIPQPGKREVALAFNTPLIESTYYGYEPCRQVLAALETASSHSVLTGDYIGSNEAQEMLRILARDEFRFNKPITYRHSTDLYLIYLNNLTDARFQELICKLERYKPFVGYADLTGPSWLKTWLSTILCASYVKFKDVILVDHGDDDYPMNENVNLSSLPFEEYGYRIASVPSMLYGTLLTYKIEAMHNPDPIDSRMSLNAITDSPSDIVNLPVIIEDAKYEYLIKEKGRLLKKAGLARYSKVDLESAIKEKVSLSYIYNLRYCAEHDTVKFNVALDFPTEEIRENVKLTVSLVYSARSATLRVVTIC
jgi:hypothetical protein